ncbi:tail-anchored protein insertion receptor WRB [Ananas comosus]|uniref:Tail-anchored protein insertion receptor WRB n=1 Tax=Ananas comosus TaxID=4615 RepID=A0A6P5H6H3_ANACO|nr:tail-anchored protein insertion receptor WRB [Ananas comosus]
MAGDYADASGAGGAGGGDGDGGGGGGALSPLSIFLLVAALQLLDGFVDLLKKRGSRSSEQLKLRQEIKQLLKDASSLSTPSTFAQAAKLRRLAAAKEKELAKKQEEDNKEKKWSYDLYSRTLMISKVLIYASLVWRYWGVPVAAVPQHLLQPLGRIFSWGARDSATGVVMVGIIPWLVLTSRVSKYLYQKFSECLLQGLLDARK